MDQILFVVIQDLLEKPLPYKDRSTFNIANLL